MDAGATHVQRSITQFASCHVLQVTLLPALTPKWAAERYNVGAKKVAVDALEYLPLVRVVCCVCTCLETRGVCVWVGGGGAEYWGWVGGGVGLSTGAGWAVEWGTVVGKGFDLAVPRTWCWVWARSPPKPQAGRGGVCVGR
mgnify:CR=1 FL=1